MRLLIILLVTWCCSLYATDKAREQRWIDQTIDFIFEGEPIFLELPDHRVYSIYSEPATESANGLIILHGTGFHPNYEQVVQPMRVEMTSYNWHTLSVQLPLLNSDADYNDYVTVYPEVPPRLAAATEYLKDKGVTNIAIVAHSQGATMAAYYVARFANDVSALVLIGMSSQHKDLTANSAESLKKINIPVLDIYGSKDFPAVLQTNNIREAAAAHNPAYSQQVIDGAYHFFELREKELLDSVATWLDQYKQ